MRKIVVLALFLLPALGFACQEIGHMGAKAPYLLYLRLNSSAQGETHLLESALVKDNFDSVNIAKGCWSSNERGFGLSKTEFDYLSDLQKNDNLKFDGVVQAMLNEIIARQKRCNEIMELKISTDEKRKLAREILRPEIKIPGVVYP